MREATRNTQLDGLRGYAAVAVVVFHTLLDRDPTLNDRVVRPPLQEAATLYDVFAKIVFMLVSGETAVVLFFVLSGLVLFESLRHRHAAPAATAFGFTIRRFLRLYPTFFVCLTGALVAFAITGAYSAEASHFWPNAALVDFSVLGASWTLQVEFLAIPFILVAYWSHRRFGALGIIATYALFTAVLTLPGLSEHFVRYNRFLSCFALGLLIPTRVGATIVRWLPALSWPFVLGVLLLARHVIPLHWWSMKLAQVAAAILIALIYHGKVGHFGRVLDHGLSQYLGRISYSLYLCNVAFLILFAHWTQDIPMIKAHPIEWGLLLAIPLVGASIFVAHLFELSLERPSIALARRLTQFSLSPAPQNG